MPHPTPNPTEDLKAPVTLREERKHEWVQKSDSVGEVCRLCGTERFLLLPGWAYEVPGVRRSVMRWSETTCGTRCAACAHWPDPACQVCNGEGACVPRQRSQSSHELEAAIVAGQGTPRVQVVSAIDQPLDIPLCRVDRLILGREPFDELELSDAQRECRCDDCGDALDDFNLPF